MRTDPRPLNCVTPPFLRWLSWCDQFLYRCEENGELTRDLPVARSHHHATNAVHPPASPHGVFNAQRPTLNVQFRTSFVLVFLLMLEQYRRTPKAFASRRPTSDVEFRTSSGIHSRPSRVALRYLAANASPARTRASRH